MKDPHVEQVPVALARALDAIHEADRCARQHLTGWAKGKLQHHLVHEHRVAPITVLRSLPALEALHQDIHDADLAPYAPDCGTETRIG